MPYAITPRTPRINWLGALALAFGAYVLGAQQATWQGLRSAMPATDFQRAGLHKLTAVELTVLDEWLGPRGCLPTVTAAPPPRSALHVTPAAPVSSSDEVVAFNTSSRKMHCPRCRHALNCTRNCVEMSRAEAERRGGVPCNVCGGACR